MQRLRSTSRSKTLKPPARPWAPSCPSNTAGPKFDSLPARRRSFPGSFANPRRTWSRPISNLRTPCKSRGSLAQIPSRLSHRLSRPHLRNPAICGKKSSTSGDFLLAFRAFYGMRPPMKPNNIHQALIPTEYPSLSGARVSGEVRRGRWRLSR